MNTSMQPGRDAASSWRRGLRPLLGVLLLLGWGSATPARADFTIDGTNSPFRIDASNSPFTGPIAVDSDGELDIVAGGSVTSSGDAVTVAAGGTVNISGGSVSGAGGVIVYGGTVTISDGTVSGDHVGVAVLDGTVDISGGTVSGAYGMTVDGGTVYLSGGYFNNSTDLWVFGGTVTISGCNLAVDNGVLTGTLRDGLTISRVFGSISFDPPQPLVTRHPATQTACVGQTVSFTADAIGRVTGVTTVQWQVSHSGSPYTDVPGATATTLTVTPTARDLATVNQYHAVFTDGCNRATTAAGALFTVVDKTPPAITLNGSSPMTVECHTSYSDPGATGNDTCAGSVAVATSGSVDPNTPGSYTLTYTATDPVGNTATSTRTVNVVDTTAPVITPPANLTQAAQPGQCSAQLTVGQATARDTCAGSLTPVGTRSDGKALAAPYPVGITTITWTASDPSGNGSSGLQTVIVNDTEKPTITCPANMTVPATSTSGAIVSYPAPTATDNCGSPAVLYNPPSGSPFPVGTTTTTVHCTATDAAGNTQTCSFTVTVVPVADLSVSASDDLDPVATGSNVTYTIAVQNAGPLPAQGVVLTAPVPAGASFASVTRSPTVGTLITPKATSSTVTWNIGTLASGQSTTLTLVVKVSAKAGVTLSTTATVSSTSPMDPNSSNNSALVSTLVKAKR